MDYSALAKQYGAVSSEKATTPVDYSALAKQYGAVETQPTQTPRFDVPVDRKQQYNTAVIEAKKAKEEADYANSLTGFVGNFGKELVSNLAPSEVGLGKSVAKIFGNQSQSYTDTLGKLYQTQSDLYKLIKTKDAKSVDTTNLKRAYNDVLNQVDEVKKNLQEELTLPSDSKVVGQLGGTALDLLTAGTYGKAKTALMSSGVLAPKTSLLKTASSVIAPELTKVGEIASRAKGLFSARGVFNVAKGATIGYGYDVTQGLQGNRGEDRTGAASFVPGLGTVIGTSIPLISESVKSIQNKTNPEIRAIALIEKRKSELDKLDRTQTIRKATEKGNERGIDIKKILSETDVLHGSVDNTGKISTKGAGGAIEQYTNDFIKGNEGLVSQSLKKEGNSIAPQIIKKKLEEAVMKAGIEGKALTNAKNAIADELAGYALRANKNGSIPIETIHSAKIDKYNSINFFTEGNTKKYDKTVAKALKEIVETYTTSIDVKNINKELSKHFAVIDYLNKLDGKVVDGGKLGKYFAQTIGAIVGSQFGPLGAVVGAEAGGLIKSGIMQRSFAGKTGKILSEAKSILEAKAFNKEPMLQLPQSSNSLGNLKTSQSTTIIPTNIDIPPTIPQIESNVKGITPNKQGGFISTGYQNEGNLTTKILKDLEGKTTVSKQYILDATNRGELKQVERDLIRQVLEETEEQGTRVSKVATDKAIKQLNEKGIQVKSGDDYVTVYHGTNSKGVKGIDSSGNFQPFSYFATDPEASRMFSFGRGGKVYEAKIKVKDLGFPQDSMAGAKGVTFQSPYTLIKGKDGIIHSAMERSDTISVPDFAKKVKAELLPLKVKTPTQYNNMKGVSESSTRYETISLPSEVRGSVKNYRENIYESPIATSAGDTHFNNQSKNYFGHTRIEDMADNKTRRVIEVQSDLYQKGNLINEKNRISPSSGMSAEDMSYVKTGVKPEGYKPRPVIEKYIKDKEKFSKLEQYNDPTAHFRMVREEIKKASQDGKTKLQFPTGETAMKIEGLGEAKMWARASDRQTLNKDSLKVGETILPDSNNMGDFFEVDVNADSWIITDVLGDGKFKAVPKGIWETAESRTKVPMGNGQFEYITKDEVLNRMSEQFDISGKVDTNNPIYKFYEKEVQKYLNKFGGKRIVDDKGVSWVEIPITKEQGKAPVEAFGKIKANPLLIGAGIGAGAVIGSKTLPSNKKK